MVQGFSKEALLMKDFVSAGVGDEVGELQARNVVCLWFYLSRCTPLYFSPPSP